MIEAGIHDQSGLDCMSNPGDIGSFDVGEVVGIELYSNPVQYLLYVVDDSHDQPPVCGSAKMAKINVRLDLAVFDEPGYKTQK